MFKAIIFRQNHWHILKTEGLAIYFLPLIGAALLLLPESLQITLYLYTSVSHPLFHMSQMISGHLSHLSWEHWLGNFIGLMVFQQFYGHCIAGYRWVLPTIILMLWTSVILIGASMQLVWYAGISSVIIGLTGHCAILDKQNRRPLNFIILLLLTTYTLFQIMKGEITQGTGNTPVASFSHLAALAGGVFMGIVARTKGNYKI